jgi:hypothetical protein
MIVTFANQTDVAPTELPAFFYGACYKDYAPTELVRTIVPKRAENRSLAADSIESASRRAAHHDARSDLILSRYLIPSLSPGPGRTLDHNFLLL